MNRKLVCFTLLLSMAASLSAGDWTHWRGPEQDGISRETGLVDDWSLKDRKNVAWIAPYGGRATPIVMNGRLYLNCRTNDDVNDPETKVHAREQVICLDANTGKLVWKDVFNVFQTDIAAPRVGWASMAGDPETGNVYMHSVSGLFRCYDKDGKVQWEYSLFEEYGKISGYGGRTQTPIIDEDRVIVSYLCLNWGKTAVPPPKQTYYCFDKKTGKLLWISAPGFRPYDTNYSCPIIRVINGQRLLIGGNSDGGIHAINARSGKVVWQFKMSKRGLNASPVVEGNNVFISHGEDNIDSGKFGRIQCIDATGTGDVTKTKSVWRVDGVKAGYTGLLVKDGILYVVADTGNMYAYDSKTGEDLWTYNLGTVGKGSPVWADGKIYVMEVNGNIHICKPSRTGCEKLSHVVVPALDGEGMDEIYASPAISNGKVYFVTRDRIICLAKPDQQAQSSAVKPLGKETDATDEIAQVNLVPYEARIRSGESVSYELHAFDKNGRFIKKITPTLALDKGLAGSKANGAKITAGAGTGAQAGVITAKHGELTATARLRVFPPLPWKFEFEGLTGKQVPNTWINAFTKLVPEKQGENTVLRKTVGRGRPSNYIWLGTADMKDYVVQADVMMKGEFRNGRLRRLPSVGITANRYNLIIKGNYGKLTIQSWAPHLRMAKEQRFRSDPDVWYTMKMRVKVTDGKANVQGKVWKRGEKEPEEWTIETVDPHANESGSPGLYVYATVECFFDNVIVTKD